jgi:hypothetical protein
MAQQKLHSSGDRKTCQVCPVVFYRKAKDSQEKWDRRETCSKTCMGKLRKGRLWKRGRNALLGKNAALDRVDEDIF